MKTKLVQILRTPDAADGGDESEVDPILAGTAPEEGEEGEETEQPAAEGEQPAAEGDEVEEEQPQAKFTTEDLSSIIQSVLPAIQPPPQPPREEPRLTQEELDAKFHRFRPSAQLVRDLKSDDENVVAAAIQQIADGAVKNATSLSEERIKAVDSEIRERHLTPLQAQIAEQRATTMEREFFAANKDLVPYKALAGYVAKEVTARGIVSKDQMFSETAKATRELVKKMFGGKPPTPVASNGTRSGRRMSTLTGGGHGGGGGSKGSRSTRKPGMEIFDPVN